MKIYIDPGHGGTAIGASYKGRLEQDDVLRLARAVRDELIKQKNIEVRLSRGEHENPLITDRAYGANAWGADYFISLHRNAFKPNAAQGAEAWVYSRVQENSDTFNKARRINELLCAAAGFKDRGVRAGAPSYTDFGVNRLTKMHSCLLEVGFIDSDADNALFDSRFSAMAQAIARGLSEAVGVEFRESLPGDADGDGKITSADARLILRAATGLEKVDESVADVNGDGKITAEDARLTLRRSVGLEGGESDE